MILRIPESAIDRMRADLRRPHPFAYERVGLMTAVAGKADVGELILFRDYWPVPDDEYVPDDTVGARVGIGAVRRAMNMAAAGRDGAFGVFHVHAHMHRGMPCLSSTDAASLPQFVNGLVNVSHDRQHGIVVLSDDHIYAMAWSPERRALIEAERVVSVGMTLAFSFPAMQAWSPGDDETARYDRQSFLGGPAQQLIGNARVAVVGLGGGGSHVAQQLAHLGFRRTVVVDPDRVDSSNLNRLVGASSSDVLNHVPKTEVARRAFDRLGIADGSSFFQGRWQEQPEMIRGCDVVIGCVDSFSERRELEAIARRYLVPYVDIGMDVHVSTDEPPRIGGQVFASIPGQPCMFCVGILNEERLGREAARYGDAGARPQVVWPNGVLASAAVGAAVDLVTGWARAPHMIYLSYDGNRGTLGAHPRLPFVQNIMCTHYPLSSVGDPLLTPAMPR
jgi:hypothetical protein